ncbi:MAG: hypothetical protein ACRBHB_07770 [Arenicella sp.]
MDIKKGLIIALTVFSTSVLPFSGHAQSADDELLLAVPAIIAGAGERTLPLPEIKKLSGSWIFSFSSFNDEFRFLRSTAAVSLNNSDIATIWGDSYLLNFELIYSTLTAAYSSRIKRYTALELWGLPHGNDASFYIFSSTNKNSPGDCHYFGDIHGNINDYYIGFGGTIPCDRITKRKVSNIGSRLTAPSSDESESQLIDNTELSKSAHDKANRLQHQKNLASFSQAKIANLAKTSDAAKEITAMAKSIVQ